MVVAAAWWPAVLSVARGGRCGGPSPNSGRMAWWGDGGYGMYDDKEEGGFQERRQRVKKKVVCFDRWLAIMERRVGHVVCELAFCRLPSFGPVRR